MTDYDALVERLRGWGAPIGIEAADAIEALRADLDATLYDFGKVIGERDALRAEVEALETQLSEYHMWLQARVRGSP